MIYYIADTHFDHENIISMCRRPFRTVEEMNEALISAWNRRVSGNDTVYILGDLLFRSSDPEAILRRLRGRKRLIIGNHDSSWLCRVDPERYFVSVDDMLVTTDGEHQLTLCHYPLLSWKHQQRSYMIHGHLHANTDRDFFPLIADRPRLLNAGVDINGMQPVTLAELAANNAAFKARWRQTREAE